MSITNRHEWTVKSDPYDIPTSFLIVLIQNIGKVENKAVSNERLVDAVNTFQLVVSVLLVSSFHTKLNQSDVGKGKVRGTLLWE